MSGEEGQVAVVNDPGGLLVVVPEAPNGGTVVVDNEEIVVIDRPGHVSVAVEDPRVEVVVAAGGQGPAGRPGDPGGTQQDIVKANGDVVSLPFGTPVFLFDESDVKRAVATSGTSSQVLGLVADNVIVVPGTGQIRQSGRLAGDTIEWDTVTGMVGGLVPNAIYYLDTQSGRMTATPPSGDGEYVCVLGRALSSTEFMIRIEPVIKL